jgi:hypothetical protein
VLGVVALASGCAPAPSQPPTTTVPASTWVWVVSPSNGEVIPAGDWFSPRFSYRADPDGHQPDGVEFQVLSQEGTRVVYDGGIKPWPGEAIPMTAMQPSTAYQWTARLRTSSTGRVSPWASPQSFATPGATPPPPPPPDGGGGSDDDGCTDTSGCDDITF